MVVDNSASGLRQGAGPTEPLISSYDEDSPITRQLMKGLLHSADRPFGIDSESASRGA